VSAALDAFGFVVGLALAALALYAFWWERRGRREWEREYDRRERQAARESDRRRGGR
jgi:hypothetical protein